MGVKNLQTILALSIILTLLQNSPVESSCNKKERDTLLAFSLSTSSKPLNWSVTGDCCTWEGVHCQALATQDHVTRLWLPFKGLKGTLYPSLRNLTYLSHLNLSHNLFHGPLPMDFFSSLTRLQSLDLSYNNLHGQLPSAGQDLSQNDDVFLQTVDLSSNLFDGAIPTSLFQPAVAAGTLTFLNVSNNSFSGQIPINVLCDKIKTNGSIASSPLKFLDFSYNEFNREIPKGLGGCSQLKVFKVGFNYLSGSIPEDIFDAKMLEHISMPANQLSGLVGDGIVRLSKLKIIELYSNQLNGTIPEDIGNLFRLEKLLLHINYFTGSIPFSLNNCTNLSTLNLRVNSLVGNLSDFDFSTLQKLTTLDLGNNEFTGELPRSLYSCKSLTAVRLAGNQLRGQILPEILELKSLSFLSISNNSLTNITVALKILKDIKTLTTLILSKNFMSELMPQDDGLLDPDGFQNLQTLALGGCLLSGRVPTWLSRLKKLQALDLTGNLIGGPIPRWFGELPSLFYIDLSSNFITGEFPKELCGLPALVSGQSELINRSFLELPVFVMPNNVTNQQYNQLSSLPPALYLSNNYLSGSLPTEIGQLKFLHVLELSNNSLSGSIPDQISYLTNLERLDLSKNHLSGEIPASLKVLHFLSFFSVASNDLQGPVPSGGQFDTFPSSSFDGNPRLCGHQVMQRSCTRSEHQPRGPHSSTPGMSRREVIGLIIGVYLGTGFLVTIIALWILSRNTHQANNLDSVSSSINLSAVTPETDNTNTSLVKLFSNNAHEMENLTVSEILKATTNLSESNIIGCGDFSLVYKATLSNGSKLAVKKLMGDFGLMGIDIETEVNALSKAQHENLVSLQGYCVHNGFHLLIYPYMENRSLKFWLHEKLDGAAQLDWPTRLKIAKGACSGLAYIQELSTKQRTVFHFSIKSNNILLDENFEPHWSGFGLSRLFSAYESGEITTEIVSSSISYFSSYGRRESLAILREQVFDFGIALLELLTGKRPVEVLKPNMISRELVGWVQQMRSQEKHDQVFDSLLRGKGFEDEMMQVLDLASTCLNQNTSMRPTIEEVVHRLKSIGENS